MATTTPAQIKAALAKLKAMKSVQQYIKLSKALERSKAKAPARSAAKKDPVYKHNPKLGFDELDQVENESNKNHAKLMSLAKTYAKAAETIWKAKTPTAKGRDALIGTKVKVIPQMIALLGGKVGKKMSKVEADDGDMLHTYTVHVSGNFDWNAAKNLVDELEELKISASASKKTGTVIFQDYMPPLASERKKIARGEN